MHLRNCHTWKQVLNSQVHPSDDGFPYSWTYTHASNIGQALIHAILSKEYHRFSNGPVVLKASLRIAAYLPFIMFRCALRQSPSSSLANDCITALAEGIGSGFYRHFLGLLWKDDYPTDFSEVESNVDSEWDSFCRVIMKIGRKSNIVSQKSLMESSASTSSIDGTQSSEKPFYIELLIKCLESLHALYESLKLDNLRKKDVEHLTILSCNIANFLGEDNYLDHYIHGLRTACNMDVVLLILVIFHLHSAKMDSMWLSLARKIVCFYSIPSGADLLGEKLSSDIYCNITTGSHSSKEELTVLAMVGERFGLQQFDSLPYGVSLPLRHALDKCRDSSPNDWPIAAYVLLGRQDLAMSTLARKCKYKESETPTNVNVISLSTPYMLNLYPVTISSTISDAIGLEGAKLEDTDSVDGSFLDGMEHIFNSSNTVALWS
ncbi:hypothetical protein KIW84_030457 [Lathyrus oleraceus]|uniref:Anaphase-promoting complex subunit 1 middle domain-containing protein n=1 Tax=Pisum sativum TaxID=3888 RepID=A0A9D5AZG7_PEA|nr:hypothetical protein KIW84_030457 [Pisum sativum]